MINQRNDAYNDGYIKEMMHIMTDIIKKEYFQNYVGQVQGKKREKDSEV